MVLKIRCDTCSWVTLSDGGLQNPRTENPRVGGSIDSYRLGPIHSLVCESLAFMYSASCTNIYLP